MDLLESGFMEYLPVGVFETDGEGKYVYVNQKWQEIAGMSAETAQALGWTKNLHPDDREAVLEAWSATVRQLIPFRMEYRLLRPDGAVVWVYGQAQSKRKGRNNAGGQIGTITDITRHKRAEQQIKENNELLERIFDNKHAMIAYLDREFNFRRVNVAYAAADEKSPEYFVGKNHFELFPNPDNEAIFRRAICDGEPHFAYAKAFEYDRNKERGISHWDWGLWPVRDDQGMVSGLVLVLVDVTRRVNAESALQYERDLVNAMLYSANALVVVLDQAGCIQRFNRACEQATSYAASEVVGRYVWDFLLDPEQVQNVQGVFKSLVAESIPNQFTNFWVAKDGARRLIDWNNSVLLDKLGAVTFVVSIGVDITDKQLAQEHLLQNKARFEAVFNAIPDAAVFSDTEHKVVAVNPAVQRIFDYSAEQMLGQVIGFFYHDDEAFSSAGERRFKVESAPSGEPYQMRYRRRDGEVFWGETMATQVCDDNGVLLGYINIIRDITAQHQAQQRLRESEGRFRQLAENIAEVFWMITPDTREVIYVSPAYERIWGRSCASLYADPAQWWDLIHADDRQRMRRVFTDQIVQGSFDEVYRVVRPDGSTCWVRNQGFAVRDERGQMYRIAGIVEDVTERKLIEDALAESEAKYRGLIEGANDAIFRMSLPTGKYEYVSPAAQRVFGYRAKDFLNSPALIRRLMHPDSVQYFDREWACLLAGEVAPVYEYKIVDRKGVSRWIVQSNAGIFDEQGKLIAIEGICRDVTEQKKAQKRVSFLAQMLDQIHDSVVSMDREGVITSWNKGAERLFGFTEHEAVGCNISMLYRPQDREALARQFMLHLLQQGTHEVDMQMLRKSGELFYVHLSLSLLRDEHGDVSGMIGYAMDTTERVHAEAALRESQESLVVAQEIAQLGSWVYEPGSSRTRISRELYRITGLDPSVELVTPLAVIDMTTHPEDRVQVRALVAQSLAHATSFELETRMLRPDGAVRLVYWQANAVPGADGQGEKWYGIVQDVTERKAAEQDLLITRAAVDTSVDGIAIGDLEGKLTYVNRAFLKIWGYDNVHQVLGRSAYEFWQDKAQAAEVVATMTATGAWVGEMVAVTHDQRELPIRVAANLTVGQDGAPLCLMASFVDISGIKNIEQELARKEHTLAEAQLIAHIGSWDWDIITGVMAWSDEAYRIFGWHPQEYPASYEALLTVVHPDDRDKVLAAIDGSISDDNIPYDVEHRVQHTNGAIRMVHQYGQVYRDTMFTPVRMIGTVHDITERKLAEAELVRYREHLEEIVAERSRELQMAQGRLVRQERLATLGQLTATVSHELRNPLGAIRSSLYMARKKLGEQVDVRVDEALQRVDRNVSRCDHIIDELLDFTRIKVLEKSIIDVNSWLQELVLELSLPAAITVNVDFDQTLGVVGFDGNRLRRAVINVIDNACQALLVDGSVNRYLAGACVEVTTRSRPRRVEITICDNGPGIPSAVVHQIFEPLFSTKGFGVGLGMPTVKQIMEQHHGGVEVISTPGDGARVTLWLPVGGDANDVIPVPGNNQHDRSGI